MKTINKISEIVEMAKSQNVFIRWSRGPRMDAKQGRSLDQVTGQRHNGLSAQNVHADNVDLLARMIQEYQFLRGKDSKIYCWIFTATRNGTDSDGCPTVDADTIVPLGKVSDALIEKCSNFNSVYYKYSAKFCYNAHKPEHHEINARLSEELRLAREGLN